MTIRELLAKLSSLVCAGAQTTESGQQADLEPCTNGFGCLLL
jgi:hypothetical protein